MSTEHGSRSEVPLQVAREVQVGDVLSPLPLSNRQEVIGYFNLSPRVIESLGITTNTPIEIKFIRPRRNNPEIMEVVQRGVEDQSAIGGKANVPVEVKMVYDREGFPVNVLITRGKTSVVPSVERVITYEQADSPDKRKVVQIDGYLVNPRRPKEKIHAVKQTEAEPFAPFPDIQEVSKIADLVTSEPKKLTATNITDIDIDKAATYAKENPNGPFKIVGEDNTREVTYNALLFVGMGELVVVTKVRLERNENGTWQPEHLNYYYFLGSANGDTERGPLTSNQNTYTYDNEGKLISQTNGIGGKRFSVEEFHQAPLALFDEQGQPTGKSIQVIDIHRIFL